MKQNSNGSSKTMNKNENIEERLKKLCINAVEETNQKNINQVLIIIYFKWTLDN